MCYPASTLPHSFPHICVPSSSVPALSSLPLLFTLVCSKAHRLPLHVYRSFPPQAASKPIFKKRKAPLDCLPELLSLVVATACFRPNLLHRIAFVFSPLGFVLFSHYSHSLLSQFCNQALVVRAAPSGRLNFTFFCACCILIITLA